MEFGKQIAIDVLSGFGFQVEEIPVSDRPRADLRVTDDKGTYILEVKDKFEDAVEARERAECLSRGETFEQAREMEYNNRIKGILLKARDQLDETPKNAEAFQLIWFHATGSDSNFKYRQAFLTFYGHVYLTPMYPHRGASKECLYFDYNAAYDMPTIHALVLSERQPRGGAVIQVCLNEFAPARMSFELAGSIASFSGENRPRTQLLGRRKGERFVCDHRFLASARTCPSYAKL